MIYVKWLLLTLLDYILILTVPFAAIGVSLFTKADSYDKDVYTWGGLWGTYDNPPQGDEGFAFKRAPFPNVNTGVKGYLNRCMWMIRNPMYGFARKSAVDYKQDVIVTHIGDENISDKEKRPGWYFAKAKRKGKVIAFEFYGVFPYSKTRDVRLRLGWKIMTDKFKRYGFAQLVNTINPFDGYGDKH